MEVLRRYEPSAPVAKSDSAGIVVFHVSMNLPDDFFRAVFTKPPTE
jgi:hypothetical protein